MEWDGNGHLGGDASREGTNLFVDVGEEGVRGPPSHLFDGVSVIAMQLEGHGPTGSERMAAHIGEVEAVGLEAQLGYCRLDCCIDVG